MTIDEALSIVLNDMNCIMIPTSESEKMTKVKTNIREIILAVQNDRTSKQLCNEECGNGD